MNRSAPWPIQWALIAVAVIMVMMWIIGVKDTARLAGTIFQTAGSAVAVFVLGIPAAADGFNDGRDFMESAPAPKKQPVN